jgi:predicted dehydrogenase
MNVNRRMFLAAGAGAGFAILNAAPSDTIRLGVIGSGSRGTYVMGVFQKNAGLRVDAICDVYEPNLENAISVSAKAQGGVAPQAYRNYKELLANKNIDAVLIATPEHWHSQMVLDALAAGKDVYIEKPLCHTPEEGVRLVKAEEKTKQIIQVGMQRRSYDLYQEAHKVVAAGTLGKVRMVRSWWLNNYLNGKKATKLDGKLDWEQWQGPSPRHEFDADRFKNWREYTDYSGGIVADQGAHVFDGIHMLMGAGAPLTVTATGGKPHREGFETPESVTVCATYQQDFLAVFSVNYAAMHYKFKNDQLNSLDGDEARMDVKREEFNVYPQGSEDTPSTGMKSEKGFNYATDLHVANFLECVRTRQRPTAPMALGFQAALVVQMANLSMKHGRRITWNAEAQKIEM